MLALSVLRTQAQSLSIKGRVTDASQEAVIAANVSLWTIDSTLVTGVTSDAQGKFALPKIKAGDYRLSISFIGLQSENILLKLNKSLDLGDVQLQEDDVSLGVDKMRIYDFVDWSEAEPGDLLYAFTTFYSTSTSKEGNAGRVYNIALASERLTGVRV